MLELNALPTGLRRLATSYLFAAAGLMDQVPLEEAIELLKAGALKPHLDAGLPIEKAAARLKRSRRWAFTYSALLRSVIGELPQHLELLDFIFRLAPDGATAKECLEHMESTNPSISAEDVRQLLDVFCNQGYVVSDGERWYWKSSLQSIKTETIVGRAEWAGGMIRVFVSLLRKFVERDTGMMRHYHYILTPSAYEQLKLELQQAFEEASQRAIRRSWEESPEGVKPGHLTVDGLLILGDAPITAKRKERP